MKLCQRCDYDCSTASVEAPNDENIVPDLECEFWAHKELIAERSGQYFKAEFWYGGGEDIVHEITSDSLTLLNDEIETYLAPREGTHYNHIDILRFIKEYKRK